MRSTHRLMIAGLVLVLVLGLMAGASGAAAPAGERLDLLIGFHGQPNPGLIRAFGGQVVHEFTLIPTVQARLPAAAVAALNRHPSIRYIEPNGEVTVASQSTPWGVERVGATSTWSRSKGSGVGVAVLDTGIYPDHPDLKVAGGTNTVDIGSASYIDAHGHGTHVAGTIAALNNSIGVVGVAYDVTLYAVKVLSDGGSGSWASVAAGIDWVVNQTEFPNIRVINMSLSGGGYSVTLEDSCQAAYDAGVVLVAAAGNEGNLRGNRDTVGYPARYASVIAVAASNSSNQRASFSSTGPAIELIAPGVGVNSTVPTDGYAAWNGTSMASPHVAGVAALVLAREPNLSAAEVRNRLTSTAQDLGLSAWHQGSGLVRADLAVAATVQQYTVSVSASPATGGSVTGGGTYASESSVTVTATPDTSAGYHFVNWTDENGLAVTTSLSYTFTVTNNRTLVANFADSSVTEYKVDLVAQPAEAGNVNGGGTYPSGTSIKVTAEPNAGYRFVSWTEGETVKSTEASYTFEVDRNYTLVARFEEVAQPQLPLMSSTISFANGGPKATDLAITVSIWANDGEAAIAGAAVSMTVVTPAGSQQSYTGTTKRDGAITWTIRKAAAGGYTATITGVTHSDYAWSGTEASKSGDFPVIK